MIFSFHISTEELRDHIEEKYGVVYKSEQSYYDLLKAAGKSRNKSQKKNPKRDEERVILRREEIKKSWQNMRKSFWYITKFIFPGKNPGNEFPGTTIQIGKKIAFPQLNG